MLPTLANTCHHLPPLAQAFSLKESSWEESHFSGFWSSGISGGASSSASADLSSTRVKPTSRG